MPPPVPPLSIETIWRIRLPTHTDTQGYMYNSISHTYMPSPNTHQLLEGRKIYISSEKQRCLCTRWVCLSLGLTPAAQLIRLLCMCLCCMCMCLCACVFNFVHKRLKKEEYDCVCVCTVPTCEAVRGVGERIVQTHTGGRIKVIDLPWHALTPRSRLNPDRWHFICLCVLLDVFMHHNNLYHF